MYMRGAPLTVALSLLLLASRAFAQETAPAPEPRFERAVSSDSKSTRDERTVFPPGTPRIFIVYRIMDATKGTRLRAVWYAEKVEGIAENQIVADLSTETGAGKRFMGSFSYSKPPKGWPAGLYRVELFLNDKAARSVVFRVVSKTP